MDAVEWFVYVGLPVFGVLGVLGCYFSLGPPSNAYWEQKIKDIKDKAE